MPSGLGKRPAVISLGTAVSPTPLVLLARLGNPTITGGVQPAISTSPLRLIPTLPNPSLVRGHAARVELMEGAIIRATWHQGLTGSFATYSLPLTQAQLDAITNWADLRLRVTATGETGRTAVSWAELAVPVGAAGLTVSATALRLIPTLPNVSASVGGSPPNAVIGSPPGPTFSALAGSTITFDPIGTSDPDGAWGGTWNFGDGTSHTGVFGDYASHVVNKSYATPGTYLVAWAVLDAEGNSDVATLTLEITQVASVPTALVVNPTVFTLPTGGVRDLTAVVLDQFGNPMTDQVIGWLSSNTSRATVAPATGDETSVTAQAQPGAVTITASSPPGGALQDTASGTIVAAGTGLYPSLPFVGDQTIDMAFRALVPVSSSATCAANGSNSTIGLSASGPYGARFGDFNRPDSRRQIVTDTGFPLGDVGECYRWAHPGGLNPSASSGLWELGTEPHHTWSEFYDALFFQVEGTTWDGPGSSDGENKLLGYWNVGNFNNGAVYFTITTSAGSLVGASPQNTRDDSWAFQVRCQQTSFWAVSASGGVRIVVGKRYRLECYFKVNTTFATDPGSPNSGGANGILRVWLTNLTDSPSTVTQTHDRTAMQYISQSWVNGGAGRNVGFGRRRFDPIWGGGGGHALDQTQWCRLAHYRQVLKGQTS